MWLSKSKHPVDHINDLSGGIGKTVKDIFVSPRLSFVEVTFNDDSFLRIDGVAGDKVSPCVSWTNVQGMPRGEVPPAEPQEAGSALASPSCSRRDLPDYVFSVYQGGCGEVRLVDNATKEVLSDKFDIVFADTNAGYFVGIFRKDLRNEHFLMPCDATLERFDKSSQTWQPHRPPSTEDVR